MKLPVVFADERTNEMMKPVMARLMAEHLEVSETDISNSLAVLGDLRAGEFSERVIVACLDACMTLAIARAKKLL